MGKTLRILPTQSNYYRRNPDGAGGLGRCTMDPADMASDSEEESEVNDGQYDEDYGSDDGSGEDDHGLVDDDDEEEVEEPPTKKTKKAASVSSTSQESSKTPRTSSATKSGGKGASKNRHEHLYDSPETTTKGKVPAAVTVTKGKGSSSGRPPKGSTTSRRKSASAAGEEGGFSDESKRARRGNSADDMANLANAERQDAILKLQDKIRELKTQRSGYKRKADVLFKQKADLEADNQKLAAEVTDLNSRLASALAGDEEDAEEEKAVGDRYYVQKAVGKAWRICKFVKSKTEINKLVNFVIDHAKKPELLHKAGETDEEKQKIDQNRKIFAKKWRKPILTYLNEKRSYCQGQLKKACLWYLQQRYFDDKEAGRPHDGLLPSREDLLIVMKRDFSVVEEDDKPKYEDFFDFYVEHMVPAVAGDDMFGPRIRHIEPLSATKIPKENKPRVSPSTEAMVYLLYDNCKKKWEAMHQFKVIDKKKGKVPRWLKKTPDLNKDFKTEYSDQFVGQKETGGWSSAGIKKYNEIHDVMKKVRKNTELCLEVDKACQGRLWELFKDKHKRKDGTYAKKPDDVDDDDDDDGAVDAGKSDDLDMDIDFDE